MVMKINGGYYIKARKIRDSWVSRASPCVRETWDYLLREANHKDQRYAGFEVKRGQLFRSFKEIRDDLKWAVGYRFERYSENDMKHCMKLLRREGMIQLTSYPRGNLISIVQYSKYQDPSLYESTSVSTDESTSDQPVINQQSPAINKNVKNDKNIRKKENKYPPLFSEDSIEFKCANGFFRILQAENPKMRPPNLQNWAADFGKMLRIDKRTTEEMKEMIRFARGDPFWQKNILSPEKLRKHWDKLYFEIKEQPIQYSA